MQVKEPERDVSARRIEYVWEVVRHSDTMRTLAVLTCGHSTSSKAFYASLGTQDEEKSHGFTTRAYPLFSGLRLASEPTARFNARKFEAYAAMRLAEVNRRLAADDPEVLRFFAIEAKVGEPVAA